MQDDQRALFNTGFRPRREGVPFDRRCVRTRSEGRERVIAERFEPWYQTDVSDITADDCETNIHSVNFELDDRRL